jgi:hypothetical protein
VQGKGGETRTRDALPVVRPRAPLVVFPDIGMTNSNPIGVQCWGEVHPCRTFCVRRNRRRVIHEVLTPL